ncbi:MAG: ferrochelatase [Gemmatimonadetes bacterium]|nr:ferrochelatase [Gemmatimonadota bacterium]
MSVRDAAVLLLNFGEPEHPALQDVTSFLENIFAANARLEPNETPEAARARSRELARARAPGLLEDYEAIGGSPLNGQANDQVEKLSETLAVRGLDVPVVVGMQFTEPSIASTVAALRDLDVQVIVAIPVYPLCGPSTTVAALASVEAALGRADWNPEVREVTGWHRHPGYLAMRTRAIRGAAAEAGLDLHDPAVRLTFSAHGTPLRYVEEGSRYVEYVEEWCRLQSAELGLARWTLGYQNHSNRPVDWTQPDIERALEALDGARAVVVDPISFVHEQSETLVELDVDLAEHAAGLGLDFVRVPVDHVDPRFIGTLADVVLAALDLEPRELPPLTRCRCRPGAAVCFNGARPRSPRDT